jgi:hypothetical protein
MRMVASAENRAAAQRVVDEALAQLGLRKPGLKTLVVAVSRDVLVPHLAVWDAWQQLDRWAQWNDGLHVAAHWLGPAGWKPGNQFEQVLNLGFPVGQVSVTEMIDAVVPGESVRWKRDDFGLRTCHIWRFEKLPDGNTRVTTAEVFDGPMMLLLKPFVGGRWQKRVTAGVDGLVRDARQLNQLWHGAKPAEPTPTPEPLPLPAAP